MRHFCLVGLVLVCCMTMRYNSAIVANSLSLRSTAPVDDQDLPLQDPQMPVHPEGEEVERITSEYVDESSLLSTVVDGPNPCLCSTPGHYTHPHLLSPRALLSLLQRLRI